jgi:hypothetical protein
MKFKGIAIFFKKNIPKKQIQCNKSREGDPLTLLGHPQYHTFLIFRNLHSSSSRGGGFKNLFLKILLSGKL